MMSRLKLKREKFPPPFDDQNSLNTGQTNPDVAVIPEKITNERIFQRAISSANKHGINLEP